MIHEQLCVNGELRCREFAALTRRRRLTKLRIIIISLRIKLGFLSIIKIFQKWVIMIRILNQFRAFDF